MRSGTPPAGLVAKQLAISALALLLAYAGAFGRPQTSGSRPAAGPAMPLASDTERLIYRIDWNPPWYLFFMPPIEAGEATLSRAGEVILEGRRLLKIVFTARSSGALARLAGFHVEDSYEFLTDPQSLCTVRVIKKIREGRRMRDIEVVYLPKNAQLHKTEIDVSSGTPRVLRDRSYEAIPPCVKDVFSALYFVRRQSLATGFSTRLLVGDDERIKEVDVRVGTEASVRTPAGTFRAWPVDTIALLGGLFKNGGQFRMWLTTDPSKLPVKFEVQVSLGRATGYLKEVRQ